MITLNQLRENRDELLSLAKKRGAFNVRVFGSVSRGDENAKSDIDFLITLEKGRSLLDLIGLQQDLSKFLICKVDVVTDDSLNKYLQDQIINEAKPI